MAKRLIDTAIFRKDFIRGLDAPCKLLFMYLINECDHAGLWDVEFEVMEIRLGVKFKESPLVQFGNKVVAVDGGKKWFIPSFVEFQYGYLKENNRVHASVISLLSKHDLLDENNQIKPLANPSQGCKDMDMVKANIVVKEKKEKKISAKVGEEIFIPADHLPDGWDRDKFMELWSEFEKMRIKAKKPLSTNLAIKGCFNDLIKFSGESYQLAEEIVLMALKRNWLTFYEVKPNGSSHQSNQVNGKRVRDKF